MRGLGAFGEQPCGPWVAHTGVLLKILEGTVYPLFALVNVVGLMTIPFFFLFQEVHGSTLAACLFSLDG